MRAAATQHGDCLLDSEPARLRAEWIGAFQEWDRIADGSPDALLTDEQRDKRCRYYDAGRPSISLGGERSVSADRADCRRHPHDRPGGGYRPLEG